MPQAGWLEQLNIYSLVLEAEKSKIKMKAHSVFWADWLSYSQTAVFLQPHVVEREVRVLSRTSFTRALTPFLWAPHYGLIISQRSHLLLQLPWKLGFQHMNFEGTNFQSIAGVLLSLRWSGKISLNYKHSKVPSSERLNFLAKYFSAKDSASYSSLYFVEMILVEKKV